MTKHDKRKQLRLTAPDPNLPQGNGNPPTKTTTAEKEVRINMIAEMLLQGARRSQVNAYLAKTETWHPDHPTPDPGKISQRTVDLYMQRARDQIAETASKRRDYLLGKSLEQLDDLYYKSLKIQDYKTCAKIVMDRAQLTGLLRIEAISKKTYQKFDFSDYTKDDLVDLIREVRGQKAATVAKSEIEDVEFEDVLPDN